MKATIDIQAEGILDVQSLTFDPLKKVTFGLQVGADGRVWVCVDGKSFIRFNPNIPEFQKVKKGLLDAHDALRETFRIWNWLADHPDKEKINVPNTSQYRNDFYCPCCTYVKRVAELGNDGMEKEACEALCPMWEAWGNAFCETGSYSPTGFRSPYHKCSPYHKWCQLRSWDSYDRAFFALLITEWAEYLLIEDGGML